MPDINTEIGKLIRGARKKRGMTLNELAEVICKSQSTVSKYEKGEITVDIATLYDIADALRVHVEQLLYVRPERTELRAPGNNPAFFTDTSQFYSYLFDGRSNSLMRCVFDVLSKADERKYKIMMYMNFKDFDNYKNCENTYWGYIEHYDAVTNIALTNQDMPMEKASAQILASYLDSDKKWGLFNGFSSRPMMPIAAKMLFSKKKLKEDEELIRSLKISKDDIRLMKLYNMMAVT
ncbi:helix-turn-helix domain-containing protein [Gallibacter intestinalis]|uniref:Helix-turn-helix transcriptional regulator n=1 Tax=Gallibacter intestinalis TaxID=2779356 RepID=A0ABR9QUZ8_9FIRM|nr:helix-turn-helix transcriptional regulator [Gallibacter intestinalis]MBE5034711.1 helix-turn-helix transcriptional regulator [Gallibacter intestinalis]